MSQTEKKEPLAKARNLAKTLINDYLGKFCLRCEVAGSTRRHWDLPLKQARELMVGDLDMVCIPKSPVALFDFVADGVTPLQIQLARLVLDGKLLRANKGEGTNPSFYIPSIYDKKIEKNFKLEISMTTAEAWPVLFAIKTGCAEFSHKLVMLRNEGGYLPSDCVIKDGWQVWRGDERLHFAEEREFIEFCCGRWIPPQEREL